MATVHGVVPRSSAALSAVVAVLVLDRSVSRKRIFSRAVYACMGQAFDYARSKAGDVTELIDVLAGKLRPDRQAQGGGDGIGGTSLSSKSILKARYHGSSGSTVLGMANLKRIQTFLDEPQKHLGQVKERGVGWTYIIRIASDRSCSWESVF